MKFTAKGRRAIDRRDRVLPETSDNEASGYTEFEQAVPFEEPIAGSTTRPKNCDLAAGEQE